MSLEIMASEMGERDRLLGMEVALRLKKQFSLNLAHA